MTAKIRHRSLAEEVYHRLLDEIVGGKREAGAKLSEEGICSELGVSRTPAREALLMLHNDGLIDRHPRRGCFVKNFDPRETAELFECRKMLECLALELGFDTISRDELRHLQTSLNPDTEISEAKSLEIDEQLHRLILDSCPNRHLREIIDTQIRRTQPFRAWRTRSSETPGDINTERLDIINAILDGERDSAIRLLGEHIFKGAEKLKQAYRNRNDNK